MLQTFPHTSHKSGITDSESFARLLRYLENGLNLHVASTTMMKMHFPLDDNASASSQIEFVCGRSLVHDHFAMQFSTERSRRWRSSRVDSLKTTSSHRATSIRPKSDNKHNDNMLVLIVSIALQEPSAAKPIPAPAKASCSFSCLPVGEAAKKPKKGESRPQ